MELQTQRAALAGILGAGIAAVLVSDIRSRGLFPAGRRSTRRIKVTRDRSSEVRRRGEMRRVWMFLIPVLLVGIVRMWSLSARADERTEPVGPAAAVTKAVSDVLGPRPHGPVHAVTKAVTRLAETPSGPTHAVTKAITELAPEPKGPLHVVTKAITELREVAGAPIGSKEPPSDDAPDPEEKP